MSADTRKTVSGEMLFSGEVACPRCGHKGAHWFPLWAGKPEVVLCDNETGGCDEYFAVSAEVEVTVTATSYKLVRP